MTRIGLLVAGSLVSFSVFVIVFSIVLFIVTASLWTVDEEVGMNRWRRSRDLIARLKHFPFGDVIFREA